MFLIRKIGAVFRGKVTPLQVMLATVLGGMLGFVPGFFLRGDLGGGFAQSPGLMLLLLSAVLVLNANLGVFGLVTLVAKLLSMVLLPVSYALGTWLLEGPLQGLFRGLVNGKVTAWFGLEYYATSGGIVLGLGFGLLLGWLTNRTIRTIRTRMAAVEESSDAYKKYASKRSVRFLTWLLLGKGKGKQSWQELATSKRQGLPIRLLGVLTAGLLVGSVWVFQSWFSTPVLTRNVQAGLEAMNGATVDLAAAELALGSGTVSLRGLAIADNKELGKDLLAADAVVATIDTGELLRKRFVIDTVRATNARGGTGRKLPGIVVPKDPDAVEPPPPPPAGEAGAKTVEDWLQDYELWKGRLQQAAEWIEAMTGGDAEPVATTPEAQEQQRKDQEALGLAKVVAKHLLDDAPRFLIRSIDIEGISYTIGARQEVLDLRARNLSDAPALVAEALSFGVKSKSEAIVLGLTGKTAAQPQLGFQFALRQLPVDAIFGQLKLGGQPPVRGGTMDLVAYGGFGGGGSQPLTLDVPLQVTMQGTTFALAGSQATKVESLLLPIGLRGALTRPSVSLDDKVLQDALLKAGQAELANFVQGQAGKLLGGVGVDLNGLVDPNKSVGENLDAAKAKAEAEAKRLADEAKAKAEAEAKKKLEAEAKKLLPGGLQGLIPGGGNKKQ